MAAVESAVRLPTPGPGDDTAAAESVSRKRTSISRSPSPRRDAPALRRRSLSRSPLPRNTGPLPRDVDRARAKERARQLEMRQKEDDEKPAKPLTDEEKQAVAKAEYDKLLNMRSGGTYIPPARLKALQAQITDKTSKEYQRMAWEALKKSINGLINKVNVSNIKHIVPELFNENLVRGRGLFCRSIMKAQAASLPFTPIYAAMVAIVNTKLPQVGELLINRLIIQFRKAYKRNDKSVCHSSTTFIAHLINQQVAHEMLAAQMLLLLLHKPTDDSVEIAVGLMKEVGHHIEEMNSSIALAVYDQFRGILHEADIDKRVQYMIEVLFQIRKDKYKDHQAIKEELDLVEEEDQITHRPSLDDDKLKTEDGLNIFKVDPEFEANEEAYKKLKAEILGEVEGSDDEDEQSSASSSEEDDDDAEEKALEIKDQSNTDLVNLRRSIYLTIMSSGTFEEACHKLMRINLPTGREDELPSMIIECCSQERTFNKFFGLIGERFCKLNRLWKELFQEQFLKYYETIHRFETNRLRIIAQFFGHLLSTDAIDWTVFQVIKLNEEDTTSSSRIFVKILIEELEAGLGMKKLVARFQDDGLQTALTGMFPTDDPKNTRFSINFFTAIGKGPLTEGMREWLKNMPKSIPAPLPAARTATPAIPRAPTCDPDPDLDPVPHHDVAEIAAILAHQRPEAMAREQCRSLVHLLPEGEGLLLLIPGRHHVDGDVTPIACLAVHRDEGGETATATDRSHARAVHHAGDVMCHLVHAHLRAEPTEKAVLRQNLLLHRHVAEAGHRADLFLRPVVTDPGTVVPSPTPRRLDETPADRARHPDGFLLRDEGGTPVLPRLRGPDLHPDVKLQRSPQSRGVKMTNRTFTLLAGT
ncbi:Pre-mRNA-splicing factor [Sphaerulina musiva]